MKLAYNEINELLVWDNSSIPTLVIENQRALYKLLYELNEGINGGESKCILSEKDKILDLSKNAEIISVFINFDINRKSLVNKVISYLETTALNGENFLKTQELLNLIEVAVNDWSVSLPCETVAGKLTVAGILKSVGIEIKNDYSKYDGELEKLIDYMELVRTFDNNKLFVLVNLRAYFGDDETDLFLKTCLSHEYNILLIDSSYHPLLNTEKRITIDGDLCEF